MSAKLYNLTASITFINYSIQPYFQSILHNGEKVRKKKKEKRQIDSIGFQAFRVLVWHKNIKKLLIIFM